jgi:hypothetical protein
MRISRWFGRGWAQPVTNRGWVLIATLTHSLSAMTGYRVLCHTKHVAWVKATRPVPYPSKCV